MIITLGIPKGGTGKTTAILTLANGALLSDKDSKIALIDTDTSVGSLSRFWRRRNENEYDDARIWLWSSQKAERIDQFFHLVQEAAEWANYTFIDVQGEVSEFNRMIVGVRDLTIVPTRLGATDFEPAVEHLRAYADKAKAVGETFIGRLLFTFTPVILTRSEKVLLNAITGMPECPHFSTTLANRSVYKDVQSFGALLKEMPVSTDSKSLSSATDESMRLFEGVRALGAEAEIQEEISETT